MEVGTHAEQLEAVIDQPDFLEVYADRELTIFGITGRLQDLAGMCPVDLSDSRVTLEAKNEFVVKVANESGMEIAPEHEPYFSRVVERHGQERKFTVAMAGKDDAPELRSNRQKPDAGSHVDTPKVRVHPETQPAKHAPPEAHKHRLAAPPIQFAGANPKHVERRADAAHAKVVPMSMGSVALAEKLNADEQRRNFMRTLDQTGEAIPPKTHKTVANTEDVRNATLVRGNKKVVNDVHVVRKPVLPINGGYAAFTPKAPAVLARPEASMPANESKAPSAEHDLATETAALDELELMALRTSEEFAFGLKRVDPITPVLYEGDSEEAPNDILEIYQPVVEDGLALPAVVFPDELATEAAEPTAGDIIYAIEQVAENPAPTSWEAIVDKEPSEICDEFTHALQTLILETEPTQDGEIAGLIALPTDNAVNKRHVDMTELPPGEVPPIPAFTNVVADRLYELSDEDKSVIAPVLREVLSTVLAIEALEKGEHEPEIIEAAMLQLQEQVVHLFKELGTTYTTEEIAQFMHLLLLSNFQPSWHSPMVATVDLETEGTHEAKRYLVQFAHASLDEIEYGAERLLGKIALFYAPARNRSLAASA